LFLYGRLGAQKREQRTYMGITGAALHCFFRRSFLYLPPDHTIQIITGFIQNELQTTTNPSVSIRDDSVVAVGWWLAKTFYLNCFLNQSKDVMVDLRLRPEQRVCERGGQTGIVFLKRMFGIVDDEINKAGEEKIGLCETITSIRSKNLNMSDARLDPSIGD